VNMAFQLETVILQESYVVDISSTEKGVAFLMEFLLENGQTLVGRLVFPDVEAEEWLTTKGALESLKHLMTFAQRYYGGPDEKPDLGTINSIRNESGSWVLSGDWGSCRLRSHSPPKVVIAEDASLVSGPLAKF